MTALPSISDFTGGSVTEGGFKTALTDLRGFLASLLGTDGTTAAALTALQSFGAATVSKTGAYTVLPADKGKVILCTGTWTLGFTAAATLGDGMYFAVINAGAGSITLDPASSELINGVSTWALTPGTSAIISGNGATFYIVGGTGNADTVDGFHASATATANKLLALNGDGELPCSITGRANGGADIQTFNESSTWTKPANGSVAFIECIGGGGGGGDDIGSGPGGGGGGGSYSSILLPLSTLTTNVTVTVGSGGAVETDGGNSYFGGYLIAYGGGHGVFNGTPSSLGTGGGGGSGGATGLVGGGTGEFHAWGGGGSTTTDGGGSIYGGGGGGGGGLDGGGWHSGGVSLRGGDGGSSQGTDGIAPGGGGGGGYGSNTGVGADGRVTVTVW